MVEACSAILLKMGYIKHRLWGFRRNIFWLPPYRWERGRWVYTVIVGDGYFLRCPYESDESDDWFSEDEWPI